jgi:hypothetical protein
MGFGSLDRSQEGTTFFSVRRSGRRLASLKTTPLSTAPLQSPLLSPRAAGRWIYLVARIMNF